MRLNGDKKRCDLMLLLLLLPLLLLLLLFTTLCITPVFVVVDATATGSTVDDSERQEAYRRRQMLKGKIMRIRKDPNGEKGMNVMGNNGCEKDSPITCNLISLNIAF